MPTEITLPGQRNFLEGVGLLRRGGLCSSSPLEAFLLKSNSPLEAFLLKSNSTLGGFLVEVKLDVGGH